MRIAILMVFALVSGSASAQHSTFRECVAREVDGATYAPLRAKVILLDGRNQRPPFAMLTDQSVATTGEQLAIAAWADLSSRCLLNDAAYFTQIPPDAAALIEAEISGTLGLAAKLYGGEITYGQFNAQRSELGQRLNVELGAIRQRETARDDADYQMRRQAAIQYLLGQQATQPTYRQQPAAPMYAIPPTVRTDCYRFGSQTTCTTR